MCYITMKMIYKINCPNVGAALCYMLSNKIKKDAQHAFCKVMTVNAGQSLRKLDSA
jgi:hypothetical protein